MTSSGRNVRWIAGICIAIAALAAFVMSADVQTPAMADSATSLPGPNPIYGQVERRVLADSVVVRGTVSSSDAVEYGSTFGPDSRIELLVEPGDVVEAGTNMALVDGRPVIALVGPRQLAADLTPRSPARESELIADALSDLGAEISPGDRSTYGATLRDAISSIYELAGVPMATTSEPVTAGGIASGEPVDNTLQRARWRVEGARDSLVVAQQTRSALPDPAVVAREALDAQRRSLDAATQQASSEIERARDDLAIAIADEDSPAQARVSAERSIVDLERSAQQQAEEGRASIASAERALSEAIAAKASATASADLAVASARRELATAELELRTLLVTEGPVVPRSEVFFVPSLPTRVLATSDPTGVDRDERAPLLTLESGDLVVRVDVSDTLEVGLSMTGIAEIGEQSVPLVDGVEVARQGGFISLEFALPAVVSPVPALGTGMRVTLSAPVSEGEVDAVPLRAVRLDDSGRSFVDLVDPAASSSPKPVEVRPGRVGGGWVEVNVVSASGPAPGKLVAGAFVVLR